MYTKIFKLHSELLKAISHPKRLEVLHLLRNQKLTVSQIQTMLDLPQANLSQHLMVLREAGVVTTEKNGKQVTYRIAHQNFSKASDLIRAVLIENNTDKSLSKGFAFTMSDLTPLVHDVVCNMRISPKTAGASYTYRGTHYYFCASGCLKHFKQSPTKYIKK